MSGSKATVSALAKVGAQGPAGPVGPKGDTGAASTVPGPTGPKGDTGAQGPKGDPGTAGSNATATPLSNSIPPADTTTGAIGASTSAARADHAHPRAGLNLQLLGNIAVTETLLISLSLGTKRMTIPLAGVTTSDKLFAAPNGIPTAGCEMINVYPISAGNVSVGYFVPALGIGATYNIPISVYKIV